MTDARTVGLVALGGALGTLARYGAVELAPIAPGTFPTTTLLINVLGSLALGLLLGMIERTRPRDVTLRPLLGIGVLGGFTTFSTFSVETVQLVRAHHTLVALAYVAASLALGLGAAILGARLTGSPLPTEGES